MLRSFRSIKGHRLGATDGEIGRLHDLLFDDQDWKIRYLVADTGDWLPGRRVLLSPESLLTDDWMEDVLHVNLSKEEIENGPSVASDKPVSRQREEELRQRYGWPAYWVPSPSGAGVQAAAWAEAPAPDQEKNRTEDGDPHLRSAREVTGYHVVARDGEMGHIEDFIIEEESRIIRYVIVDTVNWWFGRKVILAPAWVEGISWDTRRVRFDLTREAIKDAPEYDPAHPVNREYEVLLCDYYGRPRHWETRVPQAARGQGRLS